MIGLAVAELLLHGRRDLVDVVDVLQVAGVRDARLLQLPTEQRRLPVEHLARERLQPLELQRAQLLAWHGLHLGIPELLLGIAGRRTEERRVIGRHRARKLVGEWPKQP